MEPEKWTPLDEFAKVAMQAIVAADGWYGCMEKEEEAGQHSTVMGRAELLAIDAYVIAKCMMAEKARQEAKT